MLIKRKFINPIFFLFEAKSKLHFSIETQYKIIKLKKIISNEIEIYNEQIKSLEIYFEKDINGKIITTDNGIKIKSEYVEECSEKIYNLDNSEI